MPETAVLSAAGPDITRVHGRLGRVVSTTDASGTRATTYTASGQTDANIYHVSRTQASGELDG